MTTADRSPRIVVCGSINMDLVVQSPRLPRPGETVLARSIAEVSGGKGANQAVGVARLGAAVSMIGAVGTDGFAERLLDNLTRDQVDVTHVRRVAGPSGVAIVAVEDSGENSILVIPGANGLVDSTCLTQAEQLIGGCDVLVAQLEVPINTVCQLLELAKRHDKPLVLNPAPAPAAFPTELYDVDILCPNQGEAESILGRRLPTVAAAREAVGEILARGPRAVVITLGADGAVFGDRQEQGWIPAKKVTAVDTTAAGDAFVAALAVCWGQGKPLREAVEFAGAAGACSATVAGAQPSLPSRADVLRMQNLE